MAISRADRRRRQHARLVLGVVAAAPLERAPAEVVVAALADHLSRRGVARSLRELRRAGLVSVDEAHTRITDTHVWFERRYVLTRKGRAVFDVLAGEGHTGVPRASGRR